MNGTARNHEPGVTMFVLLLWTMLALQIHGLCPRTRLVSVASRHSSSSTVSLRMAGNISRARQRDREAKTLYDYLGASPKDSQEQLKIRYQTLAKKLHPDSNPDNDVESLYYDLSEINAAWEVLKDPVERKKYDRSLQTKEITEGIESSVSKGLEFFATNAIPFLQKTAVTTAAAMQKTASTAEAAMDISSKAAKEVNEQATKAYGAFEIEQQIKNLEQKSNSESAKAVKIEKEIIALPTKKIASLEKKFTLQLQQKSQPLQPKQKSQQQQQLTSGEAQRILKNFASTTSAMKAPPAVLKNDIKALTDTETKQKEATKLCQATERATQMAERKVGQALRAEELAQKKLEEAQLAFQEAKKTHQQAQEAERKTKAEEKTAQQSVAKIETMLQRTREKVRVGLVQQQDAYLQLKTNELKQQKLECEKSSENYLNEAKALKAKVVKTKKGK